MVSLITKNLCHEMNRRLLQQGDGQRCQHQSRYPTDREQSELRAAQPSSSAVEEHHGFAAFAADREHRQQQQTKATLPSQVAIGVAP